MEKITLASVSSLCSYRTRDGRMVWVGECPAGFFYGDKDQMLFSNRLVLAFRFMPSVGFKMPDEPLAHLQKLSGGVPPALVEAVGLQLPAANWFASSGHQKDSSLPFLF